MSDKWKETQLRNRNLCFVAHLLSILIILTTMGCSDNKMTFGKWNVKNETHEYVLLTEEDARTLWGTPLPFPSDNKKGWIRVKDAGEKPETIKGTLRPYSVAVLESGFAFLQSTRKKLGNESYDDIEWAWKIVVENRSKRGICAYSGSSLFDQDGFVLVATGADWDNSEDGVYIKAGGRGVVQGRAIWQVSAEANPPTPSRVRRSDYKLFLRHANFLDEVLGSK